MNCMITNNKVLAYTVCDYKQYYMSRRGECECACLACRVAAHELEDGVALGPQVVLPVGLVHAGGELREQHVGRGARGAREPARREPNAVPHLRQHVLHLEAELAPFRRRLRLGRRRRRRRWLWCTDRAHSRLGRGR